MQQVMRLYREQTGEIELDLDKVAQFAVDIGWPLPKPANPIALLASEFARAAREETKKDEITGRPYRVNHAIAQGQQTFWFDIDNPKITRKKMLMSLTNRREGMVADGLQLTFDADHWNSIHPDEEPIKPEMDLTLDIEWRKNGEQIMDFSPSSNVL